MCLSPNLSSASATATQSSTKIAELALTRLDIDHGTSISRSPAAVVTTAEGDLTPLEDASRLAISQRVGLRGIYLSLTNGDDLAGGLTYRFRASLNHKEDGQTKFIKLNSQR